MGYYEDIYDMLLVLLLLKFLELEDSFGACKFLFGGGTWTKI